MHITRGNESVATVLDKISPNRTAQRLTILHCLHLQEHSNHLQWYMLEHPNHHHFPQEPSNHLQCLPWQSIDPPLVAQSPPPSPPGARAPQGRARRSSPSSRPTPARGS